MGTSRGQQETTAICLPLPFLQEWMHVATEGIVATVMSRCSYSHAEVPLLKDRDFLYREVTQKLPNGVFIIYGQSLSQEEEQQVEGVPCIKGVIRGEMGASGWVIAPVDGGAASSITYVALTDLKVQHRFFHCLTEQLSKNACRPPCSKIRTLLHPYL